MIERETGLRGVAFEVCTALDRLGVTAVLTGGSAATVYAPEAYQSRDLDFVLVLHIPGVGSEAALLGLGYERSDNFYVHRSNPLTIDFLSGPIKIGEDEVTQWSTVREGSGVLHILSPTDCCRDRLAAFLFWNDRRGLDQALAVAAAQRTQIDLDLIHDWCLREGELAKFEEFRRGISPRRD